MSEIARLMRQIELEYEAAQRGLEGFAITASHDAINARMEKVWDYKQELTKEVGEQAAVKIVFDLYVKVIG